jgi:hypothetical protein
MTDATPPEVNPQPPAPVAKRRLTRRRLLTTVVPSHGGLWKSMQPFGRLSIRRRSHRSTYPELP